MPTELYLPAQRLLDLHDANGALLAEFDFFPEHQLLYVRWHGHLTAASVIEGSQAGAELRHNGAAPRLLLNDKSQTTGDWSDALPWLQYEWLPQASAGGMQALAYVPSPDPTSQAVSREFARAARLLLALGIFTQAEAAWRWLKRQESRLAK